MSGALQATFMNQRSFGPPPLPAIGAAYEGGFFAGQISTTANGVATHNLVVAPAASGQSTFKWKNANTATAGATSDINGPQNTADMVADGSSTVYPAAHFCNDAVIGGFSDWYMPSRYELEVCYFNLKPGTANNSTSFGANPYAVPARASNYTFGDPAQTSATAFRTGGAEAFLAVDSWTSTEFSDARALRKDFNNGAESNDDKDGNFQVRAIRRVPV